MRPALLLTFLLSTACASQAQAQQSPNWVDPPAKSGSPGTGAERTKPAPEAGNRSEAAPDEAAETRRAAAPTRRSARRQERAYGRTADRDHAAEAHRGRRAAIRERARAQAARTHRPMSPAMTPPPAALARSEPDPRFSDWAIAAQRLSLDYLASISAPNGAMLASAPRFYGGQVRFHGRNLAIPALMAEKRRFVRRWPERRYEPQGEPRVACDGPSATCLVRTVYDFTAVSPSRGARSQGVAELLLTVSFAGGRPVVVSESSRVLSRGGSGGA
ncbi:hypothetical protein MPAR168_15915 [Methylorubrum populi]|uniref:hypothetical protein n=2 Tax=Methylobacteriaceae TaxID=119045 RepID=UPI002F30A079